MLFLWDKEEQGIIVRSSETQPAACLSSLHGQRTRNGPSGKQIDVVKCTLLMLPNSDMGTV